MRIGSHGWGGRRCVLPLRLLLKKKDAGSGSVIIITLPV